MDSKAQDLWFLLNKIDRSNLSLQHSFEADKEAYPYFYLLFWNEKFNPNLQKKIALMSSYREHFFNSIFDIEEMAQPFIDAEKVTPPLPDVKEQLQVIDNFLQNLPSIARPKKNLLDEDSDVLDLSELKNIIPVSETFAKILESQEKYERAIEMYEKLSLIKPEKSLYFATRISELKHKLI
ncbi:hypothetical protein [Aquirufa ecclesiirivi]|uniref:Tetratricopeptide repeat protein n=1 Tax=Aquirufa ecclesiirivi TaxID=2715124 RepID=A0ABT4JF30_9BACT|nr:hypothetical protein [Aquirufa ecclesiirivi]MCZ2472146.1 hypothetical protein [Aquirufa ecclesiirivi]MCZ2474176.1 hypothetical protein [Aquirufa ecclesiirivi]MDF0693854.1 hypothetical protein [Aquirufa ecclesiirivi]NHC48532.1 hypothetical protein [Aquirufa ecclesiirivi]